MSKVTPLEDKDFAERKPYFDEGVHEVYIEGIEKVEPSDGAPYLNVTVLGEGDTTEDIRVYISEKAAPYTLANLARIAVHNKKTDAEKQAVRDAFKAVDDTDKIDKPFLAKFKDMQAWILTEQNLNAPKEKGGYFLRSSLYSYEPKVKQLTAEQLVAGIKADSEPFNDEVPFGS